MYRENFKELLRQYKPMICKHANRLPMEHREDLFQIGCLALYKANKDFDSNRGTKFITLAYRYVFVDMHRYMRKYSEIIRVPVRKYETKQTIPCLSLDMLYGQDLTLINYLSYEDKQEDIIAKENFYRVILNFMQKSNINQRDQEIFLTKYYREISTKDLLLHYKFTKQNLSVKLSRIKEKLKKYLEKGNYYEI